MLLRGDICLVLDTNPDLKFLWDLEGVKLPGASLNGLVQGI